MALNFRSRDRDYCTGGVDHSAFECPLWVISGHSSASIGMSGKGQKRASTVATNATALAENGLLFDPKNGADIGDPGLCGAKPQLQFGTNWSR